MRPEKYGVQPIIKAFRREKVITIEFAERLLGFASKRTVVRKLTSLGCRTSYSHCGKYYTLDECVKYNRLGLWTFNDIHFSKYGTLMDTILHFINFSQEGYFAYELEAFLHVRVHNALTTLHSKKRLLREQMGRQYLYLSPVLGERQLEKRHQSIQKQFSHADAAADADDDDGVLTKDDISETIQESMRFLITTLNEKQRRLYLGMESMKLGHGGDTRISQITGVNPKTIARGRCELQARSIIPDRIRRAGAGRPSLKKKK